MTFCCYLCKFSSCGILWTQHYHHSIVRIQYDDQFTSYNALCVLAFITLTLTFDLWITIFVPRVTLAVDNLRTKFEIFIVTPFLTYKNIFTTWHWSLTFYSSMLITCGTPRHDLHCSIDLVSLNFARSSFRKLRHTSCLTDIWRGYMHVSDLWSQNWSANFGFPGAFHCLVVDRHGTAGRADRRMVGQAAMRSARTCT